MSFFGYQPLPPDASVHSISDYQLEELYWEVKKYTRNFESKEFKNDFKTLGKERFRQSKDKTNFNNDFFWTSRSFREMKEGLLTDKCLNRFLGLVPRTKDYVGLIIKSIILGSNNDEFIKYFPELSLRGVTPQEIQQCGPKIPSATSTRPGGYGTFGGRKRRTRKVTRRRKRSKKGGAEGFY